MSPRSPSTSTGCRPPSCVAAIACCVPWSMSTPTAVANASPHDASNGAARSPRRPAGSAAFRTDSPVPPPISCGGGFPELHFGRDLSTCNYDPQQAFGDNPKFQNQGGRAREAVAVPSGRAATAWRGAAAGGEMGEEASLFGKEWRRRRRRTRWSRSSSRRRRRRRPWRAAAVVVVAEGGRDRER